MAGAGICLVTRIYLSRLHRTLTLGLAAEAKARTNLLACIFLQKWITIEYFVKDRWNREMEKQRNGDDAEIHRALLFWAAVMSLLRQPLDTCGSKLLKATKAFLFDCDGVIWKGNQPIPGSIETLNYLKKIGKHVFYVVSLHGEVYSRRTTLRRAGKRS